MAPSARSDTLANLGLGLGLLPAIIGTGLFLRPGLALDSFGVAPTAAADGTAMHAFVRMHAVRDLVVGLLLVGLHHRGDRRLLGLGLLTGCFMAGYDGLVSHQLSGRGEWQHWGLIPLLVGVGAPLAWQG